MYVDSGGRLGLLLLHALPLDGSMWDRQINLLPGSTYAPTLYSLGDGVEEWAASALNQVNEERIVVVGCSVGGSCALEVAAIASHRVAALVLIGTKARHRPDPILHMSALETMQKEGLENAWDVFWAPLFSKAAAGAVVDAARLTFLRQPPGDVARGVTAFHSRPSRDEILSMFSGQVAVITGAEDTAPGPKVSAAQANSARRGRLYVIPECGHYVPLEQPEHLNSILRNVIAAQ
ncbi:alpha/beta hydrolase [Rhizobium leguminosarum]|uniref:Alpha/beta hydrolase n=1 Tax=Rhizobium beringeri TaxID=3019934 RepID=A0ABY1XH37_9HYPH|nr:alpha/beta hydrolase [Rhizobium leguminosarum]TBC53760.1 alpha/beta hydrolase [Rhizobium leguminosarum]TBE57808.1 alpha/beta hydrolase [Rhizobium beringeri]